VLGTSLERNFAVDLLVDKGMMMLVAVANLSKGSKISKNDFRYL
jgi:flagella basal body P-ring formation protein FlgA